MQRVFKVNLNKIPAGTAGYYQLLPRLISALRRSEGLNTGVIRVFTRWSEGASLAGIKALDPVVTV
jgi:hypothetical protein